MTFETEFVSNDQIQGCTTRRIIVVQRNDPNSDAATNSRKLLELKELARAVNYVVVGTFVQSRHPDRKYQIGCGKVDELAEFVESLDAEKVIFNNPLSMTQIYNVSEACKCGVIDRFQLILEIFAARATTRRAKLQVELAELQYELPKAKSIVSLQKKKERQGFMGLGSYEDSYEQDIKKRIARIRAELQQGVGSEEQRTFRHEKGFSLVTLAGYTNAGKSTLFQSLIEEETVVRDMLFTTLSPTTRSLTVNRRKMLLTDTVGFISDLPHWMVDAFRSTLDEIFMADIILLVVDMSDPVDIIQEKLAVSHDIFLGRTEGAVIVTALNKADLIPEEELQEKLEVIRDLSPAPVMISAKSGEGLTELKQLLFEKLPTWEHCRISIPTSEEGMSMVSWLHDEGIVHTVEYGDSILMEIEARDEIIQKVQPFIMSS
ncbi:GTP-binding protein HflX [Methanofollis sp. W23]|uniref:GTPase HflX n=1 Tax=Methanofollis sp. W23 TaxID=2817849 RepID=UPI001AE7F02F|nr:GTPase HflX [Methanofollis sp. W23]MBP2145458.1 GTP-binding protein HflX [Methanofollis sp. W23]